MPNYNNRGKAYLTHNYHAQRRITASNVKGIYK